MATWRNTGLSYAPGILDTCGMEPEKNLPYNRKQLPLGNLISLLYISEEREPTLSVGMTATVQSQSPANGPSYSLTRSLIPCNKFWHLYTLQNKSKSSLQCSWMWGPGASLLVKTVPFLRLQNHLVCWLVTFRKLIVQHNVKRGCEAGSYDVLGAYWLSTSLQHIYIYQYKFSLNIVQQYPTEQNLRNSMGSIRLYKNFKGDFIIVYKSFLRISHFL